MAGCWLGHQFWENGGWDPESPPPPPSSSKQHGQNSNNDFFDWLAYILQGYYIMTTFDLCYV